jgi:predicted dehydrogenase
MNAAIPQLSRRQFLSRSTAATTASAAALAFPQLLTRTVVGASAAREGVKVGVIGVGNQGKPLMLMNYQNVVAVCDVDRTRVDAAKKEIETRANRPCPSYTDYRKLLENKDVDAVIVATPDHWHALMTIHACQAGKDVYVEKPLSLHVHEGRVMVQVARRTGRIIQTGSQQRSDDKFRLACELVRSGRIGKVRTVRVGIPGVNYSETTVPDSEPPPELDYDLWLGPAPFRPYNKNRVHYNFRFFWDYSGGQMTNWGAHHLDIAQWGLGMDASGPVEIEGQAHFDKEGRYEVPIWGEIIYQYAQGPTMYCGQSHRMGTTFEGERGTIHVNRGKLEWFPAEANEPLTDQDTRLEVSKNHYDNWYECIKSRKLPICDVEVGHRTAAVCHLGNIAMRLGRKIRWDPVTEKVVDDAEASRRLSYEYRAPWKLPTGV